MDIQIQQMISQQDWQHLTAWDEHVFPEEGRHLEWGESSHHIIARDPKGVAVGHIGVGEFAVSTKLATQYLLGVGGVVVHPEYQGQGVPQKMFEVLHIMPLNHFSTSTFALFCPPRLVSYYQRFGYEFNELQVISRCGDTSLLSGFCFMTRGELQLGPSIQLHTLPW